MNGTSPIEQYCTDIIEGVGGLHALERYELAVHSEDRDTAVAEWVIRCLANVENPTSRVVLDAIQSERRKRGENI